MIKKTVLSIMMCTILLILIGCTNQPVETNQYYTVTFVTNTTESIEAESVLEGTKITEPSVTKEGYRLLGWFLDNNEEQPWNFEEDVVDQTITLYAAWEEIAQQYITTEEMLVKLNDSIYQNKMSVDENNGLSDASSVGVDQQQLENEIRYPVPETSEFDHIYYVDDYELSPLSEDNTNAFNAMLNDIKTVEGSKLIMFGNGQYKFRETITISDMDNVYMVGQDTEWLMRSWQTMLIIDEGENFHINNIDFDYEISPTISGEIVSTNSEQRSVSIRVDDEFDLTNFRYNGGTINYGNYMEYVFDEFADAYIPDANGMLRYNSTGDQVNGISDGQYDVNSKILTLTFDLVQGAFKAPDIGKTVSVGFTMYEYAGLIIKETKNFYMETVNIYTTPGMAIRTESCENLYFNRINLILKSDSKRLMTATADGLHAADTAGEIIMSNSIFEASHDDSINIKTFYFKVDSVFRNQMVVNMTTTEVRIPIKVGDQLEIFEDQTFTSKATITVVAVESYGTTYEITLDKNLPTGLVLQGDLVGNLSRIPKVTIENSIFRNKRNRGILLQARESKIINSTFYNIIHGPIMIHAAIDIFSEAIVPQNITIENCKFIQNNTAQGLRGDISVFRYGGDIASNTITDITIQNNYFYQSAYQAVYLLGTGNVLVVHNLFQDAAFNVTGDSDRNSAVYVKTSLDTTIEYNLTYMSNPKQYFEWIYTLEDEGTIIQFNHYNLEEA